MHKKVTIFLAMFICVVGINAQDNYRAIHWTTDDGLSVPTTFCMIKDIKGFLWIGSGNWLNRFDGKNFKYYYADKAQKTSIADNEIIALSEDSLHNIWIGTHSGLSRYDIRADTFTNFVSETNPNQPGQAIIPFWAKKNEMLCWDYKTQAVVSYNTHSLARKIVARFSQADSLEGWSLKFSYSIFDEAGKSIWMLTGQNKLGGLLQVSLTDFTRKFYFWPLSKKNNKGVPKQYAGVEGMRFDPKRNCIWINSPEGLMNFTLHDKQFHHIDALDQYTNLKDYDRFPGIDIDTKGRIWFAARPKGIIIYDPANNTVELPFPNDAALQVDASKNNACIYCDREGIVWTGSLTNGGVYEITPFSNTVTHYLSMPKMAHSLTSDGVYWFKQGMNGKIWLTTSGGINIYDPQTGKFDVFKGIPGVTKNEDKHDIQPIYIDTISKKALIEHSGLLAMDLDTKKCLPVIYKDSTGQVIDRSKITPGFPHPFKHGCITRASYGNREGIFIVDVDSPVARQLLSFPAGAINDFFSFANDSLVFIQLEPGERGHLTYAFAGNKLIRFPCALDTIEWGDEIVYSKADQTYWVPSGMQLIHFDKDFRIIRRFTTKDGLPFFGISCLTLDNSNNLWFHTDRSIHELNTVTGVFAELTKKDGFDKIEFFNYPAGLKADNGDIYFPTGGANEGFVRIVPDKFVSRPSSVYIEAIEVNQKPLSSPVSPNNLEQLSLSYFENKITLETGVIDYYSKGKGHIRYKLEKEGKTAEWQYTPAYYTIRYENLSPAKYKLIIQASNASNEFNGPVKTLIIHISPPWWKTWWAYTLYAILSVLAIWSFIGWRTKTLQNEKIILEEKVDYRTQQLKEEKEIVESTLNELKSTQSQLIQSEKMASLGELTAGIAHEIQNPLNFVNNFSEVSYELLDEMKTELTNGNNEDAIAIADDVKQNLEKILHHGKRADAIVKGMLQHSRTSTGKKEPVDINALADEYLRLSYHGLRAKDKTFNATLKTDFDESIGNINIIPQDIGRVLLNLINNAFYAVTEKKKQHIGDYEPTVSLSTKKNGNRVEINVSDNGNGIPQKVLDKIFQPFFTTKPTGQGTGLGLSLSYDIIKVHGGEIKVKTEENIGAEFIFTLPF